MTETPSASKLPGNTFVAVVTVALGLLLGGLMFTVALLVGVQFWTAFVMASVVGVVAAIGMVCWALFVRSQSRKKAVWLGVWQSTLTGSAPADADPDLWLPKLRSRRRSWKILLIAAPIEFGLFSALGLVLVISEPAIWWHWAELLFFAAAGIGGFFQARLQLSRIDQAISGLQERATWIINSRSPYPR